MNKIKQKYKNRQTLKINEKNDIDSIIEIYQRFGRQYNVITATLEPDIQYQTKNLKITQTYTTTIIKTDIDKMIKKLEKQGRITLIIIDDLKNEKKNNDLNYKIKKLRGLNNVKVKRIRKKDTFKTLDKIIKEVWNAL